jgi:hypothetical protein
VKENAKEDDDVKEKEWRQLYADMKNALIFRRFHCILY